MSQSGLLGNILEGQINRFIVNASKVQLKIKIKNKTLQQKLPTIKKSAILKQN